MKSLPVSPLAPPSAEPLPPLAGVQIATGAVGLRYQGRADVLLAVFAPGTRVAGVFTRSSTAAAPVVIGREHLRHGLGRALLVNAGQANCFVGDAGPELVHYCTQTLAGLVGCDPQEIFMASTGVIGQKVPQDKLVAALPELYASLDETGWPEAARAICTTDTFPKLISRNVAVSGRAVTINGIAKGSGMVAPNMATMLGFIFTDVVISREALQQLVNESNAKSFNCISVDGDCSTNDTLLAFATGKAGNDEITHLSAPECHAFRLAFEAVMIELAQQIVRDGEGAQKFITVHVSGAHSEQDAHRLAMDIAESPLVKTAIAGEDANWGRIVMAIGKSGIAVDQQAINIAFGDYIIARGGAVIPGFNEEPVAAYMRQSEINITVEVGHGPFEAKVWTCDLTHGYIDINADYRS